MDLDRYLAIHRPAWERLAQLNLNGRRRARRLRDEEIDELVSLYRRTSSNLSYVRTYYGDPALIAHLSRLVASSGSIIYGTRPRTWRNFARFFTTTFPAAVWHSRRALAFSFALFFVPAIVSGVWIANSPSVVNAAAPPALRDAYINHNFEDYYDSQHASEFSSHVFTNNVRVAILAFGSGIAFGLPTVYLLITNGVGLGFAAGMFANAGQNAKFYGLIAPHGLLEITSVIVAGAAGLRLGWALIVPGDKSRSASISAEGKRTIVIVFGLVPAFGVAGFIEGFVTGQPWPTFVRVGLGVLVEVAFITYIVTRGKIAAARGFTGRMGEGEASGWFGPSADSVALPLRNR